MAGELSGRRILVTRPPGRGGALTAGLAEAGAEVIEAPLIAFEPIAGGRRLRRALAGLEDHDYIVFTSATAVRALGDALVATGTAPPAAWPAAIAVGPATAAAARGQGIPIHELSRPFTSEAVAAALERRELDGRRVLIPRAQVAGEELPRRLRRAGARVDLLPLYRTVPHPDAPERIPRLLGSGLDMVTFTSASAVHSLVAAVGPGFRRPRGLQVACIGPVTAEAARTAGLAPDVVATEHTGAGLAAAIRGHLAA